jgi:hypothetical protein
MWLLLVATLVVAVVAPIPRCSPLIFINKIVEASSNAWLLDGLPGHPQAPCPYTNASEAPFEDRSVAYFFLSRPERIPNEVAAETNFWLTKGLPRLADRWWATTNGVTPRPQGEGRDPNFATTMQFFEAADQDFANDVEFNQDLDDQDLTLL